jgi:hypothetical protein
MRISAAEVISRELLDCSGKLDQSVAVLAGVLSSEDYQRYRGLVDQIMGSLYLDILREIFEQYPDLEPDSLKL